MRDRDVSEHAPPFWFPAAGVTVGAYTLQRPLVRQSANQVWLANDALGQRVVTKFTEEHHLELSPAPHLLIPREILPLDQAPGLYCQVTEYLSLGNLLQNQDLFRGHTANCRELLRQCQEALEPLHAQSINHRDLKPANILLRSRDPLQCVIADFGSASQNLKTITMTLTPGTPLYASPEAATGMLSYKSDLFSLGLILGEMLSGTPLRDPDISIYGAAQATVMIPDELPEEWKTLIQGMTHANMESRWGHSEIRQWLRCPATSFQFENLEPRLEDVVRLDRPTMQKAEYLTGSIRREGLRATYDQLFEIAQVSERWIQTILFLLVFLTFFVMISSLPAVNYFNGTLTLLLIALTACALHDRGKLLIRGLLKKWVVSRWRRLREPHTILRIEKDPHDETEFYRMAEGHPMEIDESRTFRIKKATYDRLVKASIST